ncbi:MAG TPA: ubiquinone-binding protein [Gammaproteobacteria bacterium]|nr:ubiquinone-binding protein [Gammaproteobacteria bacterium]
MPRLQRSATVPWDAAQMYALVNDVRHYPEFFPWCRGAEIVSESREELVARITLAKGPVRFRLTTRNVMRPDEEIRIGLVEGPFRHFAGRWCFEPLPEGGSRVSFDIDFEISLGGLLGMAVGRLFDEIAGSLVDAYVRRAGQVYGRP